MKKWARKKAQRGSGEVARGDKWVEGVNARERAVVRWKSCVKNALCKHRNAAASVGDSISPPHAFTHVPLYVTGLFYFFFVSPVALFRLSLMVCLGRAFASHVTRWQRRTCFDCWTHDLFTPPSLHSSFRNVILLSCTRIHLPHLSPFFFTTIADCFLCPSMISIIVAELWNGGESLMHWIAFFSKMRSRIINARHHCIPFFLFRSRALDSYSRYGCINVWWKKTQHHIGHFLM